MNEQREEALKQLEEIRESGRFNMMNRRAVMQYAADNQMYSLVAEVGNDSREYLKLLTEMGESK
jgi:hypothetical protein